MSHKELQARLKKQFGRGVSGGFTVEIMRNLDLLLEWSQFWRGPEDVPGTIVYALKENARKPAGAPREGLPPIPQVPTRSTNEAQDLLGALDRNTEAMTGVQEAVERLLGVLLLQSPTGTRSRRMKG